MERTAKEKEELKSGFGFGRLLSPTSGKRGFQEGDSDRTRRRRNL